MPFDFTKPPWDQPGISMQPAARPAGLSFFTALLLGALSFFVAWLLTTRWPKRPEGAPHA